MRRQRACQAYLARGSSALCGALHNAEHLSLSSRVCMAARLGKQPLSVGKVDRQVVTAQSGCSGIHKKQLRSRSACTSMTRRLGSRCAVSCARSAVLRIVPFPRRLGFRQDQEGQDPLERVGDVLSPSRAMFAAQIVNVPRGGILDGQKTQAAQTANWQSEAITDTAAQLRNMSERCVVRWLSRQGVF